MATDSNLNAQFGITEANDLFKTKFTAYADGVFNTATAVLSQIKKKDDFHGKQMEVPIPFGFQGGRGTGSLPNPNVASYDTAVLSPKKAYNVVEVDREGIYASMSSEGAYVKAMSEAIRKTVESHTWNMSRMLFGSGDGSLGTIDSGGVTDNGGGEYELVISSATWNEAVWEERDFVNIETGNTDLFEITAVAPSTRTITVQRESGGTQVPVAADEIFMQGSEDNDMHGLKEVCDATSGSLYGITVGRRWQAHQDTAGGTLTVEKLNSNCLEIERKTGQGVKLIATSYAQFNELLNQLEDQKRYTLTTVAPKSKKYEGTMSFGGIQFMSSAGPIPVVADRFIEPDRCYLLNTDHICLHRRPKSGWVKDDVSGAFLRISGEDAFEARFATYGNIYIVPTFQGVISGLNT